MVNFNWLAYPSKVEWVHLIVEGSRPMPLLAIYVADAEIFKKFNTVFRLIFSKS